MTQYQAPRGTYDIIPEEQGYWSYIRHRAVNLCHLYGYKRIDTPVFEDSRLFSRTIGEETDIVQKEMYTFEDRGGELLTLRPEGTAPICRSYLERGMHNLTQPVKLYYIAPIFRYERPQAGRFRQHWQFGAEAIGDADPALDAEVIDMAWSLYQQMNLRKLVLKINSIGCRECRPPYLKALKAFYAEKDDRLCPDCRKRAKRNPLRLLDCKNKGCSTLALKAPRSTEHLCTECSVHFETLQRYLAASGLKYKLDHRLVRGLDYYTKTVFEIQPSGAKGAQSTIGGGGRYDNLIEDLGGKPTPAVGFGTGFERMILNLKKQNIEVPAPSGPAAFVACLGEAARVRGVEYAAKLRREGIDTILASGNKSLKAQMRQANALEAEYVLIIGDDELKENTVMLRRMSGGDQRQLSFNKAIRAIKG